MTNPDFNTTAVVGSVLGLLLAATAFRLAMASHRHNDVARKRLGSLASWWAVAIAVVSAAYGGSVVAAVLLAAVSLTAMHEFARLARPQPLQRSFVHLSWACIVLLYSLALAGATEFALLATPLLTALAAGAVALSIGPLPGFTATVALTVYGVVLTGCLPALSLTFFALPGPGDRGGSADGIGTFLFVLGMTEWNDIVAAWVGRRLGRRKFAPLISPNKTWEGFSGGVLATVAAAGLLGPLLTARHAWESALVGLLIGLAGTLGDLNVSAIKRAAGVKDSGRLLPGQGGILDRIDSLTFSVPVAVFAFHVLAGID